MIYACSSWELALGTCFLKVQRLKNKVLQTIRNVSRCTSVRHLHTAFNLPYSHHYITKLCRQQADAVQYHDNGYIRNIGQGEARQRKCKKAYTYTTVQVTQLQLQHKISKKNIIYFAKPGLTEDFSIVHMETFSITCCMCDTYC
jgi:hypothetical protein